VFLNDRHFVRWVEVFGSALERRAGATGSTGQTAGVAAQPSHGAAAPGLDLGDHDALTGLWNRRRFETELDRARQIPTASRLGPSTWTGTRAWSGGTAWLPRRD
jgi:hypothetical protein